MMEQEEIEELISQEQIQLRIAEMGLVFEREYGDKNPLFLCILKGATIFFSDLIRQLPFPLEIDFLKASSYQGTETSGKVQLLLPPSAKLTGRHVILVEDILDTGTTMHALLPLLQEQEPASLKLCTLLDKPERREYPVKADYVGFSIADEFVVGYGLDYNERYRNLPYVGIYR